MNKKEFLQRLRDNLTPMPEEEVSAALRYYEEYFDDPGIENEARVLKELGNPEQVAKQILADGGIREDKRENKVKQGKMPIWIALGVVLCIIVVGSILNRSSSSTYNEGNIISQQGKVGYTDVDKVLKSFENIDVEIDMMEVQIVEGEDYKVEIHYLSSDEMSYEVKNDTLICVERNTKEFKNRQNSMTIYVPKGVALNKVNIASGMGDSTVTNLTAANIVVENGMGDFDAKEVICETIDVELGMGDAKIAGTIKGDINIDNGMGDVKLDLTGKRQDYNYDIDRGMGSIKIAGTKHEGMGEVKEDNKAPNTIVVSNGMGDTEIEFK